MSAPRILLGGERTLVAAKNTVYQLWTEGMDPGMAFATVGVVSLIPRTLFRSECASINFVICKEAGEEPFEFTGPMLATFKATNDIAVFAVKQTVLRFTYLIGIPIDVLIGWKPPSASLTKLAASRATLSCHAPGKQESISMAHHTTPSRIMNVCRSACLHRSCALSCSNEATPGMLAPTFPLALTDGRYVRQ